MDSFTYDYIVVGSGPSGCTLASTLAKHHSQPLVLLLEAGSRNDSLASTPCIERFTQFLDDRVAHHDISQPISSLGGRQVTIVRGKTLGGSSAINFGGWVPPPMDDMQRMFEITGSDAWTWENAQKKWNEIERFHGPGDIDTDYLAPVSGIHGHNGPLDTGYPKKFEKRVLSTMQALRASGCRVNPEPWNGTHLGFSIAPSTAHRGKRTTAANLLDFSLHNLVVKTDSRVNRLLVKDGKAFTLTLLDRDDLFYATKEIILCAGTLGTAEILLRSGIGPAAKLRELGIEVVHDNESVGKNYRDHLHVCIQYSDRDEQRLAFKNDELVRAKARVDWKSSGNGDYAEIGGALTLGFFKSNTIDGSSEFANLSSDEKQRIRAPSVPHYEVAFNVVPPDPDSSSYRDVNIVPVYVFVHNSQDTGCVELASSDSSQGLRIQLNLLRNEYDRRVAIEATRETMNILSKDEFIRRSFVPLETPTSMEDKNILDFWVDKASPSWHGTGTCQIGRSDDKNSACVDESFRFRGIRGLRVADLSIMPFSPSTHPQALAYLIGAIAADAILGGN